MDNPLDEITSERIIQYRRAMYKDVLSGSPPDKRLLFILWDRFWWMCSRSDTKPARFMLALSASFWTMLLVLPGDTMTRPVYFYMLQIGGTHAEAVWMVIWSLVAVGLWWRLFSETKSKVMSLVVNALACLTFTFVCLAIFFTRTYPVPAAIASDLANAVAACWVLVRTHINSGPGWHDD